MVSYDLDGSETESDNADGSPATGKLSPTVQTPVPSLLRSDTITHGTNKIVDDDLAEVHEVDTSDSTDADRAIERDQYGESEPSPKRRRRQPAEPEKLEWSDDDTANNGEAAYKKFQATKSANRKRAVRSTKKAKAMEAENRAR